MLNIRKLLITICATLIVSTSALAADVEIGAFDNTNNANIEGIAARENGRISISVFNIGKTATDAENMVENTLVYANQINPNSDKSFSFPINMAGYQSGEYTLSIYQEGTKIIEKVFPFADATDNQKALSDINTVVAGGNENSVVSFLSGVDTSTGISNRVLLECSSDYDETVSLNNAAKFIIEKAPYDTNDKAAFIDSYEKAMTIAAFTENKISDIEKVKDDIEILNKSPISDVYASAYVTDTVKSNLANKITSFAPYSNLAAFDTAVKDALVLCVVNNPTGYGDISSVISAVYPDFPKNLITPAACRAVMNKSYTNMDLLRKALKEAIDTHSSTGSGGGGGGGGAPTKVTTTSTPQNPTQAPDDQVDGTQTPVSASGFVDTASVGWAEKAIKTLANKGVISGRGNEMFCPADKITRAEFVKMCVVLFKIPTNNEIELNFTDVNPQEWYYPYVKSAYGAGIISGNGADSFGTNTYITRQDAAVIINNCIKEYNLKTEETNAFGDRDSISDYALEAVETMQKLKIISGYEDGCFYPKNNITRAEAATMLFGTDERIEEI